MLSRPYDIVVMFAIFAAVVITIGFGLEDIESLGGTVNANDQSFFNSVNSSTYSGDYFKGTADSATEILQGPEGSDQEPSEESIITQGLNSLRSISQTFNAFRDALNEGSSLLGINPVYWTLAVGTLIIILFVLIYTWARGR